MADDLTLLDGTTFFLSEPGGDVDASGADGFFYRDVRHLALWQLRVDGRELAPATSRAVDSFSGRIVLAPKGDEPRFSVRRDRFVTEGVHEDVVVTNHTRETIRLEVELCYGSDFADVMEAQDEGRVDAGTTRERVDRDTATLLHDRDSYRRATTIRFGREPHALGGGRASFHVEVAPRESWSLCVDIVPVVDGIEREPLARCGSFGAHPPKMELGVDEWLETAPTLHAPRTVVETYRKSLLDLAALRIHPEEERLRHALLGGGIPWYMAVFGRDSLLAAYMTLPFRPEPAEAALRTLADHQATGDDARRDAEPGKILHELRRGILAAIGEIPHDPYYGTHDATLLFLIVLDEYERWTGDGALVRELEPNARAALAWLERYADLDGDGFLEYRRRSDARGALDNQCWKDSDDAIRFADGRCATPPIATCELQGYAYDARLRAARLARRVWGDAELAARLERDAAALRERFDAAFWLPGRETYALALDGDKDAVDSLTSNIGHLLWSGIVPDARAPALARHLVGPELFSGFGVRTMSCADDGYHPLGYHVGTVWPHDTAIAAAGLRRYGHDDEAVTLCAALLDAAQAFDHRLPEVFAGFGRDDANAPIEYPEALRPQAWAAAAPLLVLRTLLGLERDDDGSVTTDPIGGDELGGIALEGVR